MPQLSGLLSPSSVDTIRDFGRWWIGELRGAIPSRLLAYRRPTARADIQLGRHGIVIERVKDGIGERYAEARRLEALDEEGWGELAALLEGARVRLILSDPQAFVTRISLPAAARGRVKAAVALQLRQIAPLDPVTLSWGCRIAESDKDSITMLVAMARSTSISGLQQLFVCNGLAAPPVVALAQEEAITLAPGHGGNGRSAHVGNRLLVAAALLIASTPFTTWLAAIGLGAIEESRIAELQKQVAPRIEAERRTARTEQLHRAMQALFDHPSATETLEGIALALPDTSYAINAERRPEGTLLLDAQTSDREALESALGESPLLDTLDPTELVPLEEGWSRISYRSARP